MKPTSYLTARLRLEVLDERHTAEVLEYTLRNRAFLEPWEPSRPESFYTAEEQGRLLREEQASMEAGRSLRLWLRKPDDAEGRIIGAVALSNIVRGSFQSCHLGYKLDVAETGQGYMTEALRELIRIAFEELRLHRIEANIMPRNQASLQVVERLGFLPEGLAKQYLYINGVWEDHLHMTLLHPNWQPEA
jgi:[ribosomal protein S5]-alanine N-acetyltransferase